MDDLISRDAAIEALGECPYNWNDWPEEIQAVDDWESHKEAIENIPAVDAVLVVHGRWGEKCECSVCGFQPWYEHDIHTLTYCPNCGAKMDGERSDDDAAD